MDVLNEFVDDGIDRLDRQAVAIRIIALLLLLLNCGPTLHERLEPEYILKSHPTYQKEEYPLIDYNGIEHRFKHDLEKIVFATHKRRLTKFCRTHRHWEHIQAVWSKDKINGQFRWNYFVTKDRKSFKK